jgi:hypothetical protein
MHHGHQAVDVFSFPRRVERKARSLIGKEIRCSSKVPFWKGESPRCDITCLAQQITSSLPKSLHKPSLIGLEMVTLG